MSSAAVIVSSAVVTRVSSAVVTRVSSSSSSPNHPVTPDIAAAPANMPPSIVCQFELDGPAAATPVTVAASSASPAVVASASPAAASPASAPPVVAVAILPPPPVIIFPAALTASSIFDFTTLTVFPIEP